MSKVSKNELVAFISHFLRNQKVLPSREQLTEQVNAHFDAEYTKESISQVCSSVRKVWNDKCDKLIEEGKDRELVEAKRVELMKLMPELKRGRATGSNGDSFADSAAADILSEFE